MVMIIAVMPGPDDVPPSPSATGDQQGLPEISPDVVEQEENEQIDDAVPTRGYGKARVVGLGGSAGGLEALQAFFTALPAQSGMVFVVILHLAPDHESHLAEVIARTTSMPVLQVTGRVKVEADHVYVIPPGKQLSMEDGHLILSELGTRSGKHVAVDMFFRTLADAHGPHAAAIVLSGADGDGANGIKRIKERGGLCVAQTPDEAEHDGMPRAAIATGLVDWVLPVAEMPVKLLSYWRAESRLRLPSETGPQPATESTAWEENKSKADAERAMHDVLTYLRVRSGHDFSYYKRATVVRRVGRRMQVNGIEDMPSYLAFIRTHPAEPAALLQDLLISVTNFFRDREAFTALEREIPRLFQGKGPEDTVRVWVAACASGEEAYSVAMLLREHADTLSQPPKIQVFATDLDESAIQWAREAEYSEAIAADVSEERLRRFFSKGHGLYKVKRETREIVLFALHDLLKDSPFSKLDLVTCRNLFIYLNAQAQARVLEIFHFALHSEGLLFLGTSESVDEGSGLFGVIDKKRRIYTRRAVARAGMPVFTEPSTLSQMVRERPLERSTPGYKALKPVLSNAARSSAVPAREEDAPDHAAIPWAARHYDFIEDLAPPSIIVNAAYEITHLSEHAGSFLQVGGGDPTMNLLRMVHPMLRIELRAALYQAAQTGSAVETRGIPVEFDRGAKTVTVRVTPARTSPPDCFLVIFREQEAEMGTSSSADVPSIEPESVVQHLEAEIERLKAQLRHIIEDSEASKEEHKASTEELQAMNEELRSASEELETSREELQSINEELSTVNQELKSKVDELGRSNSDLQNLMASTQIATVFLDRDLTIQRYTPPAVALFNVIPTDLGRPLSDLTSRLDYSDLAADAERVLSQLSPVEVEVSHRDGRHFLARTLPYRTGDDRISGVVITFIDITRRCQAEEELRASEARFRAVADLVPDLLYSTNATGQLLWCNQRWLNYTGQTALQAQGYGWVDSVHPDDRARVRQSFLDAVETGTTFTAENRLLGVDGSARWFLARAEPFRDEHGQVVQWFGAKTDIEDFKATTAELATSQERLRLILENAREFAIFSTDLERRITTWNPGAEQIIGFTEAEIIGRSGDIIFTPEDRAQGRPDQEASEALDRGRAMDQRWHQRKDGERFWANGAFMRMNQADGEPVGFVKIMRDETEALQTRQALEQSRQESVAALREAQAARAEAEAANQTKDHFLAVLSHELRTPLMPVTMAVHMLRRDRTLSKQALDALEMIERNVAIEAHFIDDLLDITRITRGTLEIVTEPTNVHQAIQHALEVTASEAERKRQTVAVELKAKRHDLVGDATRLQQLFWNLLKNASKFTPEAGEIRITTRNKAGKIVVDVSDSGVGFEPDAAARIFHAFEQASPEVARTFGGLGLGLAISKATADAHGGTLLAYSEGPNRGAKFTVELPLSK